MLNSARVTSISLGRPMATEDGDCHCALPVLLTDDELARYPSATSPTSPSQTKFSVHPLTGFIAFCGLCRVAGRIQKLEVSSHVRPSQTVRDHERILRSVQKLQRNLAQWQNSLPREFFPSSQAKLTGSSMTLSVLVSVVYAGSMLNIHR